MPVPDVRVEAGFASAPDDPAQQWTDISPYVRLADGISLSRGRSNEFDGVEPGRCTLALDNSGGEFTFGNPLSPFAPASVQMQPADALTNTAVWYDAAFGYDGSQPDPVAVTGGMQLSWTTTAGFTGMQGVYVNLTAGVRYVFEVTVTADAGAADWRGTVAWQTSWGWVTPDGTPQTVAFEWTPPTTRNWIWGIEVGPSSDTYLVSSIRVWPASGAGVKPRKRLRVSTSADGATWSPRWDGYVDGWPASWANGVTEAARVQVGATDRMLRLTRVRTLRDPLLEELGDAGDALGEALFDVSLFDDATATFVGASAWLYGLQEQSGAVTAGEVAGGPGRPRLALTQTGSGGTATPGTAGIMPEGMAWLFSPASAGNGLTLGHAGIGTRLKSCSLFCQFAWSASTAVDLVTLGDTVNGLRLALTSTTVTATMYAAGSSWTATKTITTNDNRPHWVCATCDDATGTLAVYVDGESAATVGSTVASVASGLQIGTTASAAAVQIAWVGFADSTFTAARVAELATLATGGSERSDVRVARWLRWLGLSTDAALDTGLSDVAYQATGDKQVLDLVNDLNAVESGVLFPTGDGRYAFHGRSRRYSADVAATIDAADLTADLQVGVDATRLINDATASRPSGATARVVNHASIADYGTHSRVATVYAADDDAIRDVAAWWVNRYGTVHPYVGQVTVNLLSMAADAAAALLSLDIGSRIQITGLPADTTPAIRTPETGGTSTPGGTATLDLFVEGVQEDVSATSWRLTLSTSPAMLWSVARFDDAKFDVSTFAY